MRKQSLTKRMQGFSILESVIAVMLVGVFLSLVADFAIKGANDVSKKAAAEQLKEISEASSMYIGDNVSTLQSTATSTAPAVVTMATLIAGNYLPANYSTTNPWGQAYTLYVLEPAANNLEGIVLSSGGDSGDSEFQNQLIPATAAMVGSAGGFVPTGILPSQSTTTLQSAFGAWQVDISGTTIPNPGPGHLAAYVPYSEHAATSDYLYRSAIPGQPELNEMSTTLDMNGNDIHMGGATGVGNIGGGDNEGVGSVNFEDQDSSSFLCDNTDDQEGRVWYDDTSNGFFVCMDGVKRKIQTTEDTYLAGMMLVDPNDIVTKPTCPTDLPTPQIFLAPSNFAANDTGRYLKGVEVWAEDLSATQWRVHLQVMTDTGPWIEPNANFADIMAFLLCT